MTCKWLITMVGKSPKDRVIPCYSPSKLLLTIFLTGMVIQVSRIQSDTPPACGEITAFNLGSAIAPSAYSVPGSRLTSTPK